MKHQPEILKAVNIHRFSRATGNLDIMISFDRGNLEKFIELTTALGYQPRMPVKIEDLGDPAKVETWKRSSIISRRLTPFFPSQCLKKISRKSSRSFLFLNIFTPSMTRPITWRKAPGALNPGCPGI